MSTTTTLGRIVNDKCRAEGVCVLVDLAGDRLRFYSGRRGRVPQHLIAYLQINNGERAKALRDFLVNLGRGLA